MFRRHLSSHLVKLKFNQAKAGRQQFYIMKYFFNIMNYSLGQNLLRLFDVLPNFPFTTSETNRDC